MLEQKQDVCVQGQGVCLLLIVSYTEAELGLGIKEKPTCCPDFSLGAISSFYVTLFISPVVLCICALLIRKEIQTAKLKINEEILKTLLLQAL